VTRAPTLDELWDSAPAPGPAFSRARVARLPDAARCYLTHAIADGTPLAAAVRLRMHGEIKIRGWLPFSAEQVIVWTRGMVWRATIRMHGLPITGFDRIVDGEGAMRWRLLGLIPLVNASGPDIARSGTGRLAVEAIWLPSALCRDGVEWASREARHAAGRFTAQGHPLEIHLSVNDAGHVGSLRMERWGNPDGGAFRAHDFGGVVEEERTFSGYTVPSRLRAGWFFGSPEFESRGEFFRVTIDDATYR
jgi:hypothetical protein